MKQNMQDYVTDFAAQFVCELICAQKGTKREGTDIATMVI